MDAIRTVPLMVLGLSVCALLLAAGRVHAEEDRITIGHGDRIEDLTFYIGEEAVHLDIEFKNNWTSYNAVLTCPLLRGGEWNFSNDEPVGDGSGWGADIGFNLTAPPGTYNATLAIDRTVGSGVRELKVLNYTIDYRRFVEFSGFVMVDTPSGLKIRVNVRTYCPCREFHFWFIVWEDFDVIPEEFNLVDMEPGNHTFECEVRKQNLYSPAPTMAGYHGYAWVDDSHIEWDLEEESPGIESEVRAMSPLFLGIVVLITVAVIMLAFYLRSRRSRRSRPGGPDQPRDTPAPDPGRY
jgi:hypothetical protein